MKGQTDKTQSETTGVHNSVSRLNFLVFANSMWKVSYTNSVNYLLVLKRGQFYDNKTCSQSLIFLNLVYHFWYTVEGQWFFLFLFITINLLGTGPQAPVAYAS